MNWWRMILLTAFWIGFLICALDFGVPSSGIASIQLQAASDPDGWQSIQMALHYARDLSGAAGDALFQMVSVAHQTSRNILGYLACLVGLLVPFGIWGLMNLGRILQQSNWHVSVDSTPRD